MGWGLLLCGRCGRHVNAEAVQMPSAWQCRLACALGAPAAEGACWLELCVPHTPY